MTDDQIAQLQPGQKIYTYVLDEDGALPVEMKFNRGSCYTGDDAMLRDCHTGMGVYTSNEELKSDYYLSKREALVAMRDAAAEALKQAQRNLEAVQRMLDDVNSREE